MSLPDNGFSLLALDPEYTGSCPCAELVYEDRIYEIHCWRVCTGEPHVHYKGDPAVAEQMAALMTSLDWYGEYRAVEGLRRHGLSS